MVVPDFLLICEIMLMAEGFLEAKELAKKFTTLYSLNKELLSKQDHYDWGPWRRRAGGRGADEGCLGGVYAAGLMMHLRKKCKSSV